MDPRLSDLDCGRWRGEVLGVRWRDIDFKARRLHVQQTVLTVEYQIIIGRPKTLRGERKIALDDQTIQVLRNHRAAQRQEKQLLGDGYHDQGLVFASTSASSRRLASVQTDGRPSDSEAMPPHAPQKSPP